MAHDHLKNLVRTIPDFPKPGILFRDITTLIQSPEGFRESIDILTRHYQNQGIEMIVGIEARGFIFGAPLAMRLGTGFVPVRKPGKLPGKTTSVDYSLEYGIDSLHIHDDAIPYGAKVLVVDDLLATGGTMDGACRLIQQAGAKVVGCAFVIELPELGGRQRLAGYEVFSIISFEGH